jgi:hypothetical protein
MITEFQDDYRFLSNFWLSPVEYEGLTYSCSESAFQAAKSSDPEVRKQFTYLNPAKAKALGRVITLRHDWGEVRVDVMRQILRNKFAPATPLALRLLQTGTQELQEGNNWGDMFWGMVDGVGENWLGILLMEIREELREGLCSDAPTA